MGDLSSSVSELKIPSSHTIINMIIPPTDCRFCAAKRENQQKYIGKITDRLAGQTIIPVPLLPHDIRGLEHLGKLAEIMYEERKDCSARLQPRQEATLKGRATDL